MKRYRVRSAKPGQLIAYFGKTEKGDDPDVCFAWGDGCSKCDAAMLHHHLGTSRPRYAYPGDEQIFDPSFVEELKARGYDITTLKFSIEKIKE